MCGITLEIRRKSHSIDKNFIKRANKLLYHRGPDKNSVLSYKNINLGHTRLSIVGINKGDQPLYNEDKSVILICNGEIYNFRALKNDLILKGHVFQTESDNEVIVHLYEEYGFNHVEHLEGMFSYILLDTKNDYLYLTRDRLGIKPLFMYIESSLIIASSEIKSIISHKMVNPSLDYQALYDLFTFGYNIGSTTSFRNIDNFEPASYAVYDINKDEFIIRKKYWTPCFPENKLYESSNIEYYIKRFQEIFNNAVLDHLMGDVKISAYLSGGIDSTAVAVTANNIMRKNGGDSGKFNTFSLSFSDKEYDESKYFSKIIKKEKFDSTIIMIKKWDSNLLKEAIYYLEQPQILTLDIANIILSKNVKNYGFKVTLTGDGSDELLGGYNHFSLNNIQENFNTHNMSSATYSFLDRIINKLGYKEGYNQFYIENCYKERSHIINQFGTFPAWYPIWLLSDLLKEKLFNEKFSNSLSDGSLIKNICEPLKEKYKNICNFNKSTYIELNTRLPNWILWKSDRDSMANSVEARVPFLDNRLIDFFLSLPPIFKTHFLNEKYILKKSLQDILPNEILRRKKFAFNTPSSWLFDEKDEYINYIISESYFKKVGIFNFKNVKEKMNKIKSKKFINTMEGVITTQLLTGVITTQILYDVFIDGKDFHL